MKMLSWVNRHVASLFMTFALSGLCVFWHQVAWSKMIAAGDHFAVIDSVDQNRMALIQFLNRHWWLAGSYVLFFCGSLLFLETNNAPRWSVWMAFLILAVPCVIYLAACVHVANNFFFEIIAF